MKACCSSLAPSQGCSSCRHKLHGALSSQAKDTEALNATYDGISGLARALATDLKSGLKDSKSVEAHRQALGANQYKQVPPKSFFSIFFEGFNDPVILLLCFAATVRPASCRLVSTHARMHAHGTAFPAVLDAA